MKAEPGRKTENKIVTISMPAEVLEALDKAAKANHRSRSGQAAFFLAASVRTVATDAGGLAENGQAR